MPKTASAVLDLRSRPDHHNEFSPLSAHSTPALAGGRCVSRPSSQHHPHRQQSSASLFSPEHLSILIPSHSFQPCTLGPCQSQYPCCFHLPRVLHCMSIRSRLSSLPLSTPSRIHGDRLGAVAILRRRITTTSLQVSRSTPDRPSRVRGMPDEFRSLGPPPVADIPSPTVRRASGI